ncbi:hypothetical protein DEJ49_33285 [Streptomyces venezuelae]|uniref:Uncharacterized protein n=1 Tax=Streptomyces venezuelae TaxID=54571 RepID=A0A5P2CQT9_STRVZ|nr:hypothetical protein [Streptomyces venezuelae]QES45215.1 hypothetical protein DEJ49_33285 [Streptomyces venezuelae]
MTIKKKRSLPATPPEPPRNERLRVYCKVCGEVQHNYDPRRALADGSSVPLGSDARRTLFDGVVSKHRRTVLMSDQLMTVITITCPGGPVDLAKDRAP